MLHDEQIAVHAPIMRSYGAAAAYGSVIRQTETATDIEYRVLARATGLLQDASQPGAGPAALPLALHENRQVWSAFAADLAEQGNAWDDVGKARLFSLARWVLIEGDRVMRERASPAALIDVNLIVMQGLKPTTATQEAAG